MTIKGIPVGTTMPRSDWNQNNPRKADFIKNKPVIPRPDWNQTDPESADFIKNKPEGFTKVVTGEFLTIDGTVDSILHGLKLYGKSTQDGTPTPEAPVEIVSAGADGAIGVNVCGKNLLDAVETLSFTKNITVYAYIPKGTYVISCENVTYGGNKKPVIAFYNITGSSFINTELPINGKKTITITQDVYRWTVLSNGYDFNGSTGVSATIERLMMRPVSVADATYEPYKGKTLTVPAPNGLPGIKVSNGGNYTDSNGQQWICDEIDFGKGLYVRRIEKKIFDGTENLNYNSRGNTVAMVVTNAEITDRVANHVICSHFQGRTIPDNAAHGGISCRESYDGLAIGMYTGIDLAPYSQAEVVAIVRDFLVSQYNSGNPVIAMYALATPIETPLTEEEMAQYAALRTVSQTTYVFNDAGAGMEVSYYLPNAALPVSGGTMDGPINMGNQRITGLGEPIGDTDAVTKKYADSTADFGYLGKAETDDVWKTLIENCLSQMPADSVRHASVMDGGRWSVTIHKHLDGYATVTEDSYWHMYSGDATYHKRVRSLYNGEWGEWEWVNPPTIGGHEYRTTERHNGKAVYVQLVEFGALPASGSKQVSIHVPGDKIVDIISSFRWANGLEWSRDINYQDKGRWYFYNTEIVVQAVEDLSSYVATFIVKYTKD